MLLPFDIKFEKYNLGKNPGLAVMAVKNGEVVFKKGYGLSNLETEEKITSSTNFCLASVSKQYTAMAIAILEEQGKISSDDFVIQYFTDFPKHMEEIKVCHLIYHLSGLPYYEDEFCFTTMDKKIVTNDDIYHFYKNISQLDFKPGNRFEYSNGGYNLLATLVERVSGLSFQDFVRKNIFEPANMTKSTVITYPSEIENRAASYSAWPFFENIDYNSCNALYGEGGIYSSLDDTEGWIKALDNDELISPKMKEKVFTPAITNSGDTLDYGYGWEFDNFYKHKMISHSGGWLGFNTIIANFPEDNLWLVAYANSKAISTENAVDEMMKHYLQLEGI